VRPALVLDSRVHEPADVLQPPGECVALALELGEAQQARSSGAVVCDPRRAGRHVRETGRDDV
jgi:hypothetical protein